MTHDILQTDIDLAARLINEARPEEEVIAALVHRRVDPVKAAQLVDDLRNGRRTSLQPAATPEVAAVWRSRSRRSERPADSNGAAPKAEPAPRRKSRSKSGSRGNQSVVLTRLFVILVVVLGMAAVGLAFYMRYERSGASTREPVAGVAKQGTATPAPTGAATAPAPAESPATGGLKLELQPDGLRIGGSRVTAATVHSVVATLLGAPTRTNQIPKTSTTVYAYDPHGLLVYLQPASGKNSIVLDCEATGGTNGTTSAFSGLLLVEGQTIRPDINPTSLASIETLGLDKAKAGNSIWSGRYHDLDLVFACLRSPDHLSLIEIDLK